MRMNSTFFFFFFNDTATTEIYTLSLHDALPIYAAEKRKSKRPKAEKKRREAENPEKIKTKAKIKRKATRRRRSDRKSTRLNSSHANISYAVFCLKKKNQQISNHQPNIVISTHDI